MMCHLQYLFTVNKSSIVKHMISIHLFAEIIISKYFLFIDAGIIGVGGAVSPSGDVFQEVPQINTGVVC